MDFSLRFKLRGKTHSRILSFKLKVSYAGKIWYDNFLPNVKVRKREIIRIRFSPSEAYCILCVAFIQIKRKVIKDYKPCTNNSKKISNFIFVISLVDASYILMEVRVIFLEFCERCFSPFH